MEFFNRPSFSPTTHKNCEQVVDALSTFAKAKAAPNTDKTNKYELGLEMTSKVKNGVHQVKFLENWESVDSAKFEDDSNQREILTGRISGTTRGTEVVLKGANEWRLKVFLIFWYSLILCFVIGYFSNTLAVEGSSEPPNGWMLLGFFILFAGLPYFLIYRSVVVRQRRAKYYLDRIAREVFNN